DRDDDDIADRGIATLGAAEHLDAHHPPRAAIVGDVQVRLHLYHSIDPSLFFGRQTDASPPAGAGVITRQRLRAEIGRHSSISTESPTWKTLPSSCAA